MKDQGTIPGTPLKSDFTNVNIFKPHPIITGEPKETDSKAAGLAQDKIQKNNPLNETFVPSEDDNSRYNAVRTTEAFDDVLISKRTSEQDGVKVRKYLRFLRNHPSLANGPGTVARKPDPV